VLVISQDLDEIFEIADRIAVISRGYLSARGRPLNDARTGRHSDGRRRRNEDGEVRDADRTGQAQGTQPGDGPAVAGDRCWADPGGRGHPVRGSGTDPLLGLYKFFIEPLTDSWSVQEIIVKATPLVLIACGLSVCYLSNNWNIGAEGQFVFGAVCGSFVPIVFPDFETSMTLPLMLVFGSSAARHGR
jgi:hypothetical protein